MIIINNKDIEDAILYGKRIYCRKIRNGSNIDFVNNKYLGIILNNELLALIKNPIDASIKLKSLKKNTKIIEVDESIYIDEFKNDDLYKYEGVKNTEDEIIITCRKDGYLIDLVINKKSKNLKIVKKGPVQEEK